MHSFLRTVHRRRKCMSLPQWSELLTTYGSVAEKKKSKSNRKLAWSIGFFLNSHRLVIFLVKLSGRQKHYATDKSWLIYKNIKTSLFFNRFFAKPEQISSFKLASCSLLQTGSTCQQGANNLGGRGVWFISNDTLDITSSSRDISCLTLHKARVKFTSWWLYLRAQGKALNYAVRNFPSVASEIVAVLACLTTVVFRRFKFVRSFDCNVPSTA